jgi:hypothetical protein
MAVEQLACPRRQFAHSPSVVGQSRDISEYYEREMPAVRGGAHC